jgi:hypothetical protein
MVSSIDKARQADCFSFSGCHYDAGSGVATLSYDVDGQGLEEKIVFPWAPWPVDASRQAAFFQALELLHLIAGVSYYKAGLAPRINPGKCRIDVAMADFLNTLYTQGLGEFAYMNELDLTDLINFETNIDAPPIDVADINDGRLAHAEPLSLDLPDRALVAMGGGKDSLVCQHILRQAGVEVQPVCIGNSVLIGETVKAAGLPLIRIQREISDELVKMNAEGAWNGHVPVTAINSAILLCAALLYGYRFVVFANEASANEATLTDKQGSEVNHQYSKSLAFEQAFRDIVAQRVSSDVEYFSLLRPYNEVAITRLFSDLTGFHEVFSSCNRNFHQDGSHIDGRWCRECPKCRFTALAMAPFMTPQQLIAIQGADLLDQAGQLEGFKALCGLGMHKPFECVGSIAESRAVVKSLLTNPHWASRYIVNKLKDFPEIQRAGGLELDPDSSSLHCIPKPILARLNAL